ncbi:DUF2252 domain-containing protein [Luteimicrobium xylanilyticum]|uniref:Polyphosphate kinase n=1 Tax=Luteimicrobium xylanilyticum TaxID=1133546 RepID=A0A5P9QE85_9MICO|nr:DUF2252 domain-containing protein [Luteimicrobium xylanilyticum]QFU99793.1 Polyphosphate kinase [Luteimicrobium xylanilyticum]
MTTRTTPDPAPAFPASGTTRPTVADRVEQGRSWRRTAPLDTLGDWSPAPDRLDPVSVLGAQDASRVPELVPIRYGRMSASPFAFYRGSAAVMAADLATLPRTAGVTQLCGDAHVANFGVYAAADRSLVFDINDFDETLPGPFEWDVLRLAASLVLAARDRGFERSVARDAARAAARAYRLATVDLARQRNLDVWYARVDEDRIMRAVDAAKAGKRAHRTAASTFDKARGRTSLRAAEKLTELVDGRLRFREAPPLISREPLSALDREQADTLFESYRSTLDDPLRRLLDRFEPVDAARKVVGVGSVGTRAYVLLLAGRDDDDPLILQLKQAQASVLEKHLGASEYGHSGQRVVNGQRYAQAASDILLGWVTGPGGFDFYVRQLHDMKGSIDLARVRRRGLVTLASLCGSTLARAHARSGDAVAVAAYLGHDTDDDAFDKAVGRFARRYADQAESDAARLDDAIRSGDVEAVTGV